MLACARACVCVCVCMCVCVHICVRAYMRNSNYLESDTFFIFCITKFSLQITLNKLKKMISPHDEIECSSSFYFI
ncbi:uncharacterized protein B0P05DRAFT_530089 [Gilbertella persicaria]|uniref:uncharacterized protein n=1 Tax=Gilbertella persicaria TaxID=101096 RepID=UPI00221FB60E|nr:uncharacterized protein B0P05DRAFT_530089 [Gilbertella persicaria]KAI8090269.1 hypothetical protein B0P05DRAFT_530089 [Gilbertella persicaria]